MTNSSKSEIIISPGGTTYAGPDATELFRAAALKAALKLAIAGIPATRGFTLTKGLALCIRYTGRTYRRTEAAQALADLQVWIETMKSALPTIREPM
jgi:hypothetical protein